MILNLIWSVSNISKDGLTVKQSSEYLICLLVQEDRLNGNDNENKKKIIDLIIYFYFI